MEIYYQDKNLIIRPLQEEDCGVFAEGFAAQGWNKPLCQFQKYLEEQKAGSRKVVAAQWQGEAAGYSSEGASEIGSWIRRNSWLRGRADR